MTGRNLCRLLTTMAVLAYLIVAADITPEFGQDVTATR
jgi:hypothetical protein